MVKIISLPSECPGKSAGLQVHQKTFQATKAFFVPAKPCLLKPQGKRFLAKINRNTHADSSAQIRMKMV